MRTNKHLTWVLITGWLPGRTRSRILRVIMPFLQTTRDKHRYWVVQEPYIRHAKTTKAWRTYLSLVSRGWEVDWRTFLSYGRVFSFRDGIPMRRGEDRARLIFAPSVKIKSVETGAEVAPETGDWLC